MTGTTGMASIPKIVERVTIGAKVGVVLGGIYSVVGGAVVLLRGAIVPSPEISLYSLVMAYMIGGPISGALAGALLPIARSLLGSILVGFLSLFPLVLGARLVIRGFVPWDEADSTVVAATSLLIGGMTGAFINFGLRQPSNDSRV
jgi:hypothetical protein